MKLFLFNNDEKLIGTVSPLEGIQNEEINKIQTIECTVVYSELIEKASYIGHKDYSDNRIFHLYKIDHVTKTSTTDVKIVGVHTFFDDMESDGYVKDFRPTNRELVGVLTTILDGSRWQLGTVNIQRRYTGNFYYVTRKEAISKLIEATQIEIKPRLEFSRGKITGRYLDVFTRLGGRNGKVFVHGRDLLTVSEKKSQGAIYTAVVGRGKGEETDTGGYGRRISFKDVEWRRTSGQPVDKPVGQEYVEIPAMTKLYGFEKGTKPRIKIVEFQDETDKEKLLRLSYEWLEKNSRMQVEYSAKVLNVGNLELGDTVGIFNPKLGIKYETRVFKVKRNLVNNKLTEFGIGDKVTTSPFSRTIELAKEMKNFQDDTVYWLDKIRERLSDKLINEDGYNYDLKADNEYKVPAGYYSFDKPIDQNPTKVVYMGAGKIAIADSKKPTGEWNWKTFLDGRGATLDLINTGVLKAGRIQSADGRSYWDLDTGEFHMEQSAINEAVKTAVNGKVQEIVGEVKKNLPSKEELKGKSSYLHKKYSDYSDGRNMSDNSTLKYIGIYTGEKEQAPTNASEYSWTKIKSDGKLYKAYSNSLNGLDFTLVEPDENAKLFAKNRPRVNIVNNNDISDIWQANMFLSFKPNTKYTLTARAKGNSNKLWAYFRNNKTNAQFNWGQLEFRGLETKSITFTTTNDVEDVLFKFVLVPEDEDWTGIQIDWFTIYEGDKRYTDYPTNEPAQYHKYRYFGYVFKESTPVASDFEWFDLQQTSITNDKYTHIVYSDNADGSNFGREPKKYMGVARTTSPTQPTDKTAYKWFKVKGEDGVDGKSYARNYLSGTADEKILLAINDNYDVQEAFKLVDNKNFRDLGFKNGDKITFIADYEILPNGINKKINKLNFEWHDDNQYRVWMDQDINPTKGTYVRTLTMDNNLLDCKRARFRADNVNARIKITNARVIQGDTVQPWSIAQEDLQGHSLTANVRFEGTYRNNITNNVKIFAEVYYDGQRVTNGYNLKIKHKGGNNTQWGAFYTRNYTEQGEVLQYDWGNKEQNGTPLEVIVLIDYKGLTAIASERLENVPDVTEIKETIRKYKTFDSTLERFNSTIGEVKQQIVNANRNYIKNSGTLSDVNFGGANWEKTVQNGTIVLTKLRTTDDAGIALQLMPFLKDTLQNETVTWSMDIKASKNISFNRAGQETNGMKGRIDITTQWQRISHTFTNRFTQWYSFVFYGMVGTCSPGDKIYIRFPKLEKGNVATEWTVAPEDVSLLKETTETSIEQTNRNLELKVSKNDVIASINASVETDGQGVNRGLIKINADKVDVTGMLSAYIGKFGNFQLGQHWGGSGQWITGADNFSVGMSDGSWDRTALWVNWGGNWSQAGNKAWYVTPDGRMMAYNKAEFWSTPVIHGDLKVTGNIVYDGGKWCYSKIYTELGKADGNSTRLFLRGNNGLYDYIVIDSLVSDRRLKSNIKKSTVNALEVLNKFKTYSFTRKYRENVKDIELGIMAQDVKEYMKDAFVEHPDGYYTYEPFEMQPYLIKAIQELSQENTNLKSQLKKMNDRLNKLEDKINGNL